MMIPPNKADAKTVTSLILGVLILVLLSPVIAVYSLYVAISLPVKRDKQSNTLRLRQATQKSS